jgi:hypothetical protein
LDHCVIAGTFEGSDPADTGVILGVVHALHGLLETEDSRIQLSLTPEFLDGGTRLWFDGQVSTRAGTLLAFPLVAFFHLPKRALAQFAIERFRRQES